MTTLSCIKFLKRRAVSITGLDPFFRLVRTYLPDIQQDGEDTQYMALKQAKTLKAVALIIDNHVDQFQVRDHAIAFHKIFAIANKRDRIKNELSMENANRLNQKLIDHIKRQFPLPVHHEYPNILFTLSRYDKNYRMKNSIDLLLFEIHEQLSNYQVADLKTILVALAFSKSNLDYVVDSTIQQLQIKILMESDKAMTGVDGEIFSGIVWAMAMLNIKTHHQNMNLLDCIVDVAFQQPNQLFKQNDIWSRFLFGLGALRINLIEEHKQTSIQITNNLIEHASRVDLVHYVHAFAQLQINDDLVMKLLAMLKSDIIKLKPHSVHELICSLVMLRETGGMVEGLMEAVKSICTNSRKLNKRQKLSLLKGLHKLGVSMDFLEDILEQLGLTANLSERMMDHIEFGVV